MIRIFSTRKAYESPNL